MKTLLCMLAVSVATAASAAACGDQRGSVTARGSQGRLSPSPCRGVVPWRGAARKRCIARLSRWVHVESIRLTTRLPRRVLASCAQARRLASIAVVCPPLVPAGGVVADPNLYGAETMNDAGDFYLLTFNNGDNRGYTHWIIGAGRGQTVHRYVLDPRIWVVPGRIRRLGERRYGPWTVTFYGYPPHPSGGPYGGHILALARMGGTTYFVSVHGRTHRDADAAMLLAILLTASPR